MTDMPADLLPEGWTVTIREWEFGVVLCEISAWTGTYKVRYRYCWSSADRAHERYDQAADIRCWVREMKRKIAVYGY